MAQTLAVIDQGEQPELLICRALAKASNADVAVLIGLDPSRRPRIHAAVPDARTVVALADVAARSGGRNPNSLLRGGQHPILGEVVLIGPEFDENTIQRRARVLALSRRNGFTPDAQALLAEAVAPVTFMMPRVAAACVSSQAARDAAEAAAALNLTPREVEVLQPYLSSSVKIKESHQQARPMIHLDARHKLTLEMIALHDALAAQAD